MSEKGVKSSFKSKIGSGKDDSSTKAKTAQKVRFVERQGFTVLSGSDEQAQAAKGGKGVSSKSKKGSGSKPPEFNTEKELPSNAKLMMDCEAFDILDGIKAQIAVLSSDPTIKIPVSFDRGLEYLKYGSCYANPESVRQILEPLKKHGVAEAEICMVANVCPESKDEVLAFLPSMKGREDTIRQLEEALGKLTKLKRCT